MAFSSLKLLSWLQAGRTDPVLQVGECLLRLYLAVLLGFVACFEV